MTLFDPAEAVRPQPASGSPEPDEPAARRPPRWSVTNWPVRWKVLAIALVPMALAMVFGGLRVAGALSDASRLRLAADRAEAIPAITDYLSALDGALVAAASGGDVQGAMKRYGHRTDELSAQLAGADVAGDVRSGVTTLIESGRQLLEQVSANGIGLREQVSGYAPILLTAEDTINGSVRVDDERIRAQAEGLSRAVGARGQMTMAELLVNRGGELPDPELRTSMTTLAGTEPSTLFGMSQVLGVDSADAKTLQQQLVTRMAILADPESVLPGNPVLRDSIRSTDRIAARVIDDSTRTVTTALGDLAADRRDAAIRDAVLMLVALAIVLAVVGLVARSLVRPLRTLRDGALRVAHGDLEQEIARVRAGDEREPSPLPVYTTEEVGQVAHAVDELHAQALLLAGDEARLRRLVNEMFETMSRRNRSLVEQQLALIERLERDEADPERLDSLFRLDHLAARMRRNGANLLVLAGAHPAQDRTPAAPLSTVVSTAAAEVEDYRRVRTGMVPDVTVLGAAVADTVHLLAELVDNALRYSPPSARVQVSALTTRDAGVLVKIVDAGLGMTEADLRMANMRLAGGTEVTPDSARHMGFFVVGRLAHRHRIGVRLSPIPPAAGRGITVEVYLPPALLAAGTGAEPPAPRGPRAPAVAPAGRVGDEQSAPAPRDGARKGGPAAAGLPQRRPGAGGAAGTPPETPPEARAADPEEDVIYQRMRSEWLVDPHELGRSTDLDWKSVWDHGWSLAADVENLPVVEHTEHGLPVREPGARLVPGSATPDSPGDPSIGGGARHRADFDRDPDAVRASIAGHFGGVRAARAHSRESM